MITDIDDPRRAVLAVLARYHAAHPHETAVVARIRALVESRADCLLRTCEIGHVTASALVLSPGLDACLLTHHKKLDRWLQLGGHVDGDSEPHRSALREALEESGMTAIDFWDRDELPAPFDLDVHPIPARKDEPEHEHHDFRYLLVARAGEVIRVGEESNDLRWFPLSEVAALDRDSDESLARLARRALEIVARSRH